ncbi:MAG: site-2 protease family protein [Planctomycetaceae bacterium]|nr:site-2 protease family protein [Planctomycetaceae bacterium]
MHFELLAAAGLPSLNFVWSIVQMIIGIGLVIFVHELGHFLAAKACGVKCEKFYVGFDAFDINLGVLRIPSRLAYFQWGETEYGIGILPLGGYVKMLGQHDNPMEAVSDPHAANESIKLASDGPRVDAQPNARPAIDPRSFQAKTVPQRMLIMSAGVIVNMVFAVIFASIAFLFGVSYPPALVGDTVAGSPAWENNLSGTQILEINGASTQDKYFPFDEVAHTIMVSGGKQPIQLEIKRPESSAQTERLFIQPVFGLIKLKGFSPPSIGIGPMLSTRLGADRPTSEGQAAHDAGFEPNDVIVRVNGTEVNDRVELGRELYKYWDQPLTFTVLRGTKGIYFSYREYVKAGAKDGELIELTVQTNPLRECGMVMKHGPVTAVQIGSPAHQQRMRVGDVILKMDGQDFDPLLAPQYLRKMAREVKPVEFLVQRQESNATTEVKVLLTPRFSPSVSSVGEGMPVAVEEIGVAMHVYSEIKQVVPDGPAAKAGLRDGDKIVSATIDYSEEKYRDLHLERAKIKPIDGEALEKSWGVVHELLQLALPSAFLKLKVERDGKPIEVELLPVASTRHFSEKRGLALQQVKEIYTASDFADSVVCGWQQVQYDSGKILGILRQMVTGNLPLTAIGGVGSIAVGATSEAMSGTTRLLLFLTLLSVNLAILNFLPIPILDGGHMVFLAWEGVTGQPPNEKVQEGLTMIGALLLLGLIIFALGLDAWRIIGLF